MLNVTSLSSGGNVGSLVARVLHFIFVMKLQSCSGQTGLVETVDMWPGWLMMMLCWAAQLLRWAPTVYWGCTWKHRSQLSQHDVLTFVGQDWNMTITTVGACTLRAAPCPRSARAAAVARQWRGGPARHRFCVGLSRQLLRARRGARRWCRTRRAAPLLAGHVTAYWEQRCGPAGARHSPLCNVIIRPAQHQHGHSAAHIASTSRYIYYLLDMSSLCLHEYDKQHHFQLVLLTISCLL